jgi:plastocyanin
MRSLALLSRPLATLVLAAAVAACSTGSSASPSAATTSGSSGGGTSGNAVEIKGFAFAPASLTVSVGSTVTWTNQDSPAHTVTADDASFDSKQISNGASFKQTFAKAGTFTYHCAIHTSMKGTIVVQ